MGLSSEELTPAAQDYLRRIYDLQAGGAKVTTSAIAERMDVTAASVSGMLKRLSSLGLIEHEPYHGVRLTEAGERAAIEMIRHHRLLEQYLAENLGLPMHSVHAEADRLEHALSEELEARLDEVLGFPASDPHGHPIPTADLRIALGARRRLVDLLPGDAAVICEVPDADAALLEHLESLGLVPGRRVELLSAAPFGGPLMVRADQDTHAISRELAVRIGVTA
jgi:DtxR family Mn-dependent transcriptional regulator